MEHPAAVEALAEEFSWAGADITQTFTYYSHTGVGTPEDCSLTVSATNHGEFDPFFSKTKWSNSHCGDTEGRRDIR